MGKIITVLPNYFTGPLSSEKNHKIRLRNLRSENIQHKIQEG